MNEAEKIWEACCASENGGPGADSVVIIAEALQDARAEGMREAAELESRQSGNTPEVQMTKEEFWKAFEEQSSGKQEWKKCKFHGGYKGERCCECAPEVGER